MAVSFWKSSPFTRLIFPMIIGILFQWNFPISSHTWLLILFCSIIIVSVFFLLPLFQKFRLELIAGIAVFTLFVSTGALLIIQKDIRNKKNWFGHIYSGKQAFQVKLSEPLIEKPKSFKANADIISINQKGKTIRVSGKIIIYFRKELNTKFSQLPGYGSIIGFSKSLQEIKNSGNPGAFDYKQYCFFQGITHQVFLDSSEYIVAPGVDRHWLKIFLYKCRDKILTILRENIPGKEIAGLAEALMIGYKNDLDPSLVQSYSNTGVVHIIAISGLHLGLIYALLVQLLAPLNKKRNIRLIKPLIIICFLWLFTLLAGAQPSVLRSAVMFSCLILGETISRRSSIYNTLAVSAFILLCINPFWLWDIGFQLSFAAGLSIVIFMRPVYNLFYFPNKFLDLIWKLNAVTIAAQLLTLPFCIYHFHQFPNYFILTNLVAVPLSSGILLAEILLCAVSIIPAVPAVLGKLIAWLIGLMNMYIKKIESLPFSIWEGLLISSFQALLLFIFISCFSYWLIEKTKKPLLLSLFAIMIFLMLRTFSFYMANSQQKIVIYNIPNQQAINFIRGREYFFLGEKELLKPGPAFNFHLKPGKTIFRLGRPDRVINTENLRYFSFLNRRVLFLKEKQRFLPLSGKIKIDLAIISGKEKLDLNNISNSIDIKQLVFDATVPLYKIRILIKQSELLNIPYYSIPDKGAFVMNLR